MAIRIPHNDERGIKRFLKLFDGIKVIEKKITLSFERLFLCIRFKDIPRILERMFPEIPFKNIIFIMAQQIDQAFPTQKFRSLFGNTGDFRKMLQGFKRMGFSQLLSPCIP